MIHASGPMCATAMMSHAGESPTALLPSLASTHVLQHRYLHVERTTTDTGPSHDAGLFADTNHTTPAARVVIPPAAVYLAMSSRGWRGRDAADGVLCRSSCNPGSIGRSRERSSTSPLATDVVEVVEEPSRRRGRQRRSISLDWGTASTAAAEPASSQPIGNDRVEPPGRFVAFMPLEAAVVPVRFRGASCAVTRSSMADCALAMGQQAFEAMLGLIRSASTPQDVFFSVRILVSTCVARMHTIQRLVDSCMLDELLDILQQKLRDDSVLPIVVPILIGLVGCWRTDPLETQHVVPLLLHMQAASILLFSSCAWTSISVAAGAELYCVLKQAIEAPCATFRAINRITLRQLSVTQWICHEMLQPEYQLALVPAAVEFLFSLMTQDDTFVEDIEQVVLAVLMLADFTHSKSHRSSLGGGRPAHSRARSHSTTRRTLLKRKVRRSQSGLHTGLKRLEKAQLSLVRRFLVSAVLKAMHHFHLLIMACNHSTAAEKRQSRKHFPVLRLLEQDQNTVHSALHLPTEQLWTPQASPAGRAIRVARTASRAVQQQEASGDVLGKIGSRNMQLFAVILPAEALMSMIAHFSDIGHNDTSMWEQYGPFCSHPKRAEPVLAVLCLRALVMLVGYNEQALRKLCLHQELAAFVPHILGALAADHLLRVTQQAAETATASSDSDSEQLFIKFCADPTRPICSPDSVAGLADLPTFCDVHACATLTTQQLPLTVGAVIECIFDLNGGSMPYHQLCGNLLDQWDLSGQCVCILMYRAMPVQRLVCANPASLGAVAGQRTVAAQSEKLMPLARSVRRA